MDTTLPDSPLIVRLLAEHPWTLATPLLIAGALAAWFGARNERWKVVLAGVGALLVAAAVLAGAALWQSPGEQAAEAVRRLVASAEEGDVEGVVAAFEGDASIHYGAKTAPGESMDDILRAAQSLRTRHRIESNAINELSFATVDDATAQVILRCSTTTAGTSGFALPTTWWMELRRQPDGRWLVSRIAFLRFGNQTANRGVI